MTEAPINMGLEKVNLCKLIIINREVISMASSLIIQRSTYQVSPQDRDITWSLRTLLNTSSEEICQQHRSYQLQWRFLYCGFQTGCLFSSEFSANKPLPMFWTLGQHSTMRTANVFGLHCAFCWNDLSSLGSHKPTHCFPSNYEIRNQKPA